MDDVHEACLQVVLADEVMRCGSRHAAVSDNRSRTKTLNRWTSPEPLARIHALLGGCDYQLDIEFGSSTQLVLRCLRYVAGDSVAGIHQCPAEPAVERRYPAIPRFPFRRDDENSLSRVDHRLPFAVSQR